VRERVPTVMAIMIGFVVLLGYFLRIPVLDQFRTFMVDLAATLRRATCIYPGCVWHPADPCTAHDQLRYFYRCHSDPVIWIDLIPIYS